jgi:hypothetical protein
MTLTEFRNTDIANAIIKELEKIREENYYDYVSKDFQAAVFFALGSIENGTLSNNIEDKLLPYLKRHRVLLRHILTNYLEVTETAFNNWAQKRASEEDTLELNQQCGLFTPTYDYNKDLIH